VVVEDVHPSTSAHLADHSFWRHGCRGIG
jgi:hypothetical protein